MSATLSRNRQSVYSIVTEKILEALDKGVVPWRRPWGGKQLMPKSATTGKHYRGINVWLLFVSAECHGYESPWWVTYKQAQALGGQVKKGEKSTLVTFWKEWTPKDAEEDEKIPVLRYFNVFNAAQCDGLGAKFTERPDVPTYQHDAIEECERIAAGYPNGPTVEHGGFKACYQPGPDRVMIPRAQFFEQREEYYSALFHELVHSTGHAKRLNREDLGKQDIEPYGREELIAEMGAALLCGVAGISPQTIDNSASYIDNWRRTIKEDVKLVVRSAAAAQKAADCVLGATSDN